MTPAGTTVANLSLAPGSITRDMDAAAVYRRVGLMHLGQDPLVRPLPPSLRCAWAHLIAKGCRQGELGLNGGQPCEACANKASWLPSPAGLCDKIRQACNDKTLARLTQLP
jgi:hypothetical protein